MACTSALWARRFGTTVLLCGMPLFLFILALLSSLRLVVTGSCACCCAGYGAQQGYPMQNGGMNPFGSPSPTGSFASYASSPQPTYQSQSPSLAARSPSPGACLRRWRTWRHLLQRPQ